MEGSFEGEGGARKVEVRGFGACDLSGEKCCWLVLKAGRFWAAAGKEGEAVAAAAVAADVEAEARWVAPRACSVWERVVGFVETVDEAAFETRELGGLRVVAAVRPVAVDLARECPSVLGLESVVDVDETPPELDGLRVGAADSLLTLLMLADAEGAWRAVGVLPRGLAAAAVFSAVVGLARLVVARPFLLGRIPDNGGLLVVGAGAAVDAVEVLVWFVARARALAVVETVVVADRVRGLTCGRRLDDDFPASLEDGGGANLLFSFWFVLPALLVAGLRSDRVRLKPEVDDMVNNKRLARSTWTK